MVAIGADAKDAVPMAKLCATCHTPEPGVMMGFLENIALKSKTIQMDFLSHKGVVKFTGDTKIKNVDSFEDIRNYKGKGFTINYIEKDGENYATEIIRFDILKTINPEEKLSKDEFKEQMKQPNAFVYDVRPPHIYKEAHIMGAKPLPAPAFDKFKGTLPGDKNATILLYGVGGCLSPTTSMNVKAMGYSNVRIYTAGFPDWSQHEFGVTTMDWLKQAISEDIPHVLVDLRSEKEVKAGHIQGAVGIPLADLEKNKVMFPSQKNAPIIFYGGDKEKAAEIAVSWGYRAVRILPVDFEKWKNAGNPVSSGAAKSAITYTPKAKPGTIDPREFEKIATNSPGEMVIVDVRNPDEAAEGKVKSAINIPVDQLSQRKGEIPAGKKAVFYCPTGTRAEMAHNILKQAGMESLYLDAIITIDQDGNFELTEK